MIEIKALIFSPLLQVTFLGLFKYYERKISLFRTGFPSPLLYSKHR